MKKLNHSKETAHLWKPKVYYRDHKIPSLGTLLTQMTSVHTLHSLFQ
jgi:hypothetical protein